MLYKDLTKNFMFKDIESKTPADIDWFVETVETHSKKTINPQTQEKIDTPDWKVIRREYAKKFYPELLEKSSTTKAKKPLTTAERLAKLKGGK